MIAVVDDDPRLLESLENLLESAGYGVRTFSSAKALLDAPRPLPQPRPPLLVPHTNAQRTKGGASRYEGVIDTYSKLMHNYFFILFILMWAQKSDGITVIEYLFCTC
jgi:CheY-like chemotaxis protein